MIHRTPTGHTLKLLRRDGHTCMYRIDRGCERDALNTICRDHLHGRIDEEEACLLLRGLNQIVPPRLGLWKRFTAAVERAFVLLVGIEEEACCGAGTNGGK